MTAPANQQIPNSDLWTRIGLDRNKAIAIASLSLVLLIVVVVQFGEGTSPTAAPEAKKASLKKEKPTEEAPSGKSRIRKKLAKAKAVANIVRKSKSKIDSLSSEPDEAKPKDISKPKPEANKNSWPVVDLTKLDLKNPFEPPADLERMKKEKAEQARREKLAIEKRKKAIAEQEKKARIQQAFKHFQQQGVRLVYIRDSQRVAQIGSRIVEQGDVLDGIRIIEIKENGSIIFEVVESFFESKLESPFLP